MCEPFGPMILDDLKKAVELSREKQAKLALRVARAAISSDDLEVRGLLHVVLTDRSCGVSVEEPGLTQSEFDVFQRQYLGDCIVRDCAGNWALGAFPAAWELAALFNGMVESGQEARVSEHVQWIEQLAWKCSGKAREALVLGALEHIVSSKKARKKFAYWRQDPHLGSLYRDALSWSQNGGSSPLDSQ